ncbi:MAG: tRNA (adenosine(37)-N6)-threonylcarbamoyltransferase complex transferase subunit TsaD [Bacillota bacterium]|nr:tRNA (adenosine(37)-N6)-threonylcarbamoyltransferase complex transferase subunit TsaD [Bacillota bacterium]MDW7730100.1 tRNA (adenosine(37)-N6)-threonylcarbamoyltransferase complex transferase subunit TsaD [Bacillota bacterium]
MQQKKQTLILGIETSCDETAAAVVADGSHTLSSIISSQVELHARFGGVVPEIASRQHLLLINSLIDDALTQAGLKFSDLHAIAVSHGPGLVGALLIGVATAKALAYALNLPLVAVNHLEAHLYANYLSGAPREYPAVILIVSGGHTELLLLKAPGELTPLGCTLDDAAGEAYDKVARVLDLGYPGGPLIDKLAREGNPAAIDFPRAWLNNGLETSYNFSFSGLKTAVINHLYHARRRGEDINIPDIVASFQEALVDVLVEKTVTAAAAYSAKTVLIAGGVAANSRLRAHLSDRLQKDLPAVKLHFPPLELCTDNAAMIAAAAYPHFCAGNFARLDLNARPNLNLCS